MPTECERSATSLAQQHKEQQFVAQQQQQQQLEGETNEKDFHVKMEEKESNSEMSTSQTSTSSNGHNGIGKKVSITSPDPTAYVAKARVTRPTPPPPSYNPMQFVQIKPCNLYQTAQQQLKKAEEVKKIKEIKKEEPEDWQNNLDNWKSSRRKRVEHIIDRVVEVKKLELEEHDRSRRKSKTFSEMIEERGERGGVRGRTKLASLAVYNEDESNDLSDLGIGTSSASGKSSQSEDYDNNSVLSDNAELDKAIFESNHKPNSITREYISSPGYDTSSSTAPGSSPDPCEYTYEGAIQDYKQRVSRATSVTGTAGTGGIKLNSTMQKPTTLGPSKESTPERNGNGLTETYPTRRGSKIEDRLIGFEVTSPSDSQEGVEKNKVDVPKIDISKRKAAFENQNANEPKSVGNTGITSVPVPKVTLRDRFNASATPEKPESYDNTIKREVKRLSGDITSIRDRMQSLEQQHNLVNSSNGAATKLATAKSVDIPVPPLKDRLSSLQNAVTKEEVKKPPVALVDARQLEIMKNEEETAKQRIKQLAEDNVNDVTKTATDLSAVVSQTVVTIVEEAEQPTEAEVDRDDSGIHTSDDIEVEEHIVERLQKQQEEQLNAAIAALAMEEKQLEEAANAVNQIEAEFAEISSVATATMPALGTTTNEPPCDMEFSVSSTNNSQLNTSSSVSNNTGNSNCSVVGNQVALVDAVKAEEVSGAAANTSCNLRRKPSNEMVHARNLLKMFKETFNNDIELDEEHEDAAAVAAAKSPRPTVPTSPSVDAEAAASAARATPIETQIFQCSPMSATNTPASPIGIPQRPPSPTPLVRPSTPSMIPRSINPTGKPPMSPKTVRNISKPIAAPTQSPLGSPSSPVAIHRPEGQFSINGRVEIFNSKHMNNAAKPPTPTLPKKSYVPHLPAAAAVATAAATAAHDEPAAANAASQAGNNSRIVLPKQQQQSPPVTALPVVTEALSISNQTLSAAKSMPARPSAVNEPRDEKRSSAGTQAQQCEVVIFAPPVTIVNPDELPKPNTVKALSSCFSQDAGGKATPPMPAPKPLPRSRIPQSTPPQSPTPPKRNFANLPTVKSNQQTTVPSSIHGATVTAVEPAMLDAAADAAKTFSVISNTSTLSSDSTLGSGPFETTAIVHSRPPLESAALKSNATSTKQLSIAIPSVDSKAMCGDPLQPNDSLSPKVLTPSSIPPLLLCEPNESSLYKLASSAPHSSASAVSATDIALCTDFFNAFEPTKAFLVAERQKSVEEAPCGKMDIRKMPHHKQIPLTSYHEISAADVKRCDEPSQLLEPPEKSHFAPPRQKTVEEVPCSKIDISKLPNYDQIGFTSYADISPTEVKRCDNLGTTPTKSGNSPAIKQGSSSKPSSPIMEARAAHSKALIETCEKIIAEERQTSNQMKSSLPSSPVVQHKSKIPKPIPCCIGGSDSMNQADYEEGKPQLLDVKSNQNEDSDENLLIARLHVVETQIKVTTTTPPASPKPVEKPKDTKKTKNIFDFLKKNFGHHDEPHNSTTVTMPASPTTTKKALPKVDVVKTDEIFTIDNSKFYIPSDDAPPPPLPKTPAPVNIEITKTITTDEILEDAASEQTLTQEINDLLDDELNKLSTVEGSTLKSDK